MAIVASESWRVLINHAATRNQDTLLYFFQGGGVFVLWVIESIEDFPDIGALALGAMVSSTIIIRRYVKNEKNYHHYQNKGDEYDYIFLHVKLLFWMLLIKDGLHGNDTEIIRNKAHPDVFLSLSVCQSLFIALPL